MTDSRAPDTRDHPKRSYEPPRLVDYGTLRKLTRGAEGTQPDGAGGGFDFTGAEP